MSAPLALLIPCYNAAAYLPRLMESVRQQTQPFDEILCYDDGSTDGTVQVARALGLRIIAGDRNRGPAYARNRLIEAARSSWIHFHDADDLLTPRYVEKISALLTDAADIIVCQMDWVLETTRDLVIAWRYDQEALTHRAVAANLANPVGVIACAFRRELLLRIGGFNEAFRTWEDADAQVRLSNAGARYVVVPEVLVVGLRHDRGISSAKEGDLNLEDRTRLFEHYLQTLEARHHSCLAEQAERHAAWLLAENRRLDLAERDLAVCRAAGRRVPSTNNAFLRIARSFLPSRWLLRQQERLRRRAAR